MLSSLMFLLCGLFICDYFRVRKENKKLSHTVYNLSQRVLKDYGMDYVKRITKY